MSTEATNTEAPADKIITWGEFLASHPPGREIAVRELTKGLVASDGLAIPYDVLKIPDIELYCDNKKCKGFRFFYCSRSEDILLNRYVWKDIYLNYRCRNCKGSPKSFALGVCWRGTSVNKDHGRTRKYGEWPPFGPHVPPKISKLVGIDKELFLKGLIAENQGMGIGAFVYYRRVVENQKSCIIDEIIKAAKRIKTPRENIQKLELARNETKFKAAIDAIKDAIPKPLLIDGQHNPLKLLHSVLSGGIHDKTDEECLDLATSIRAALTDLAERLEKAVKEQNQLDLALKRLLKSESEKGSKAGKH